MSDYDLILICQSNVVDYDGFSALPEDRLDLYDTLAYPRMVRHEGRFIGHLDLINRLCSGKDYFAAGYSERRELLNIWNLPSASGMHLANFLIESGVRTRVINNIDSEWDHFEEAYRGCSRPPLVGVSSTFYLGFKEIGRITKRLRKFDPDIEIVLGGAFANSRAISGPPTAFEAPMRKYGLRHVLYAFNSEYDLRALLLARRHGRGLEGIDNLCTIGADGAFSATAPRWHAPLLDDAPANWDKVEAPFLNRTIQIRTASGCPFSCAFCSYPTTAGGWKTLEVDRVRAHLDSIARIGGIDRIIFIDDTFNVPRQRFRELLEVFKDYDFEWFSFLRVQYVDDEVVRAMRDSGCRGVYLGIESANDRVLTNMNKKARRADFQRGMELLNRYGITSLAAFVLGFPGEDEKSIQDNIDFIENEGVSFYSLKEFFYMEHTEVHEKRNQYGLEGGGNKWSHDTMTYDQAARIKIDMFRSIKNATSVDPDTSLWYLAYLYDRGFGMDAMRGIQDGINDVMKAQLAQDPLGAGRALDGLRQMLAKTSG